MQSGVSKRKFLANIQDSKSVFRLLYGVASRKKSKAKESTYIKYSTVVEKHIIPKLGDCCPLGFTTELMDDFIRELQFEDELAPLQLIHTILICRFACGFPAFLAVWGRQ